MTQEKNKKQQIGALGEKIAAQYLSDKGYMIIKLNYCLKWGEIDVIAQKGKVVHFVEVKTYSYETRDALQYAVTHETWRPEEQVHAAKLHQIDKALETWITENEYEGEWQIDVVAVRVVPRETYASVNLIENVIAE